MVKESESMYHTCLVKTKSDMTLGRTITTLMSMPVIRYPSIDLFQTSDIRGNIRGTRIAYLSKNLTLAPESYTAEFLHTECLNFV